MEDSKEVSRTPSGKVHWANWDYPYNITSSQALTKNYTSANRES